MFVSVNYHSIMNSKNMIPPLIANQPVPTALTANLSAPTANLSAPTTNLSAPTANLPVTERSTPIMDIEQRRALLFNVGDGLKVPLGEFDEEWWPHISNVWMETSKSKRLNGDYSNIFICHFAKAKKSSTRTDDIPNDKQWKTKLRLVDLCTSTIKVSHIVSSGIVQIE